MSLLSLLIITSHTLTLPPPYPNVTSTTRQVIMYNAHRAHLVWPKLHGFMRGLLEDNVEVAIVKCPYLLERCVVTVLRAAVVLGTRQAHLHQQPQPHQQSQQQQSQPQPRPFTASSSTGASTTNGIGSHISDHQPPTPATYNHNTHLHTPQAINHPLGNNNPMGNNGQRGFSLNGGLTIRPSLLSSQSSHQPSSSSSSSSSSLSWLMPSLSLLRDLPSDLMIVVADRIAVGLLALVRDAGSSPGLGSSPGSSLGHGAVRPLTQGQGLGLGPGLGLGLVSQGQGLGPAGLMHNHHDVEGNNNRPVTTTTITTTTITTTTTATTTMMNTSTSTTTSTIIDGADQWCLVFSLLATAGAKKEGEKLPTHTHSITHSLLYLLNQSLMTTDD